MYQHIGCLKAIRDPPFAKLYRGCFYRGFCRRTQLTPSFFCRLDDDVVY
jgi:hypothetical protein